MAFEHKSGLPDAYDRATGRPEWQSLVFAGRQFVHAEDVNDMQTVIRGRHDRLGQKVAKDGNRTSGASAVVQSDLGNVILTAGTIWLQGDDLPVSAAVLSGVQMTGRVEIGVAVTRQWVTHEQDPTLVGLVPGSDGEGEPAAAREVVTIAWSTGATAGEFVPVYWLQDGTILDQTPPPMLSGAEAAIALYDHDAHGHYIVRGCRVTALGGTAGKQAFSIEEGVANILGFKRTREAALRYERNDDPDLAQVDGEVHTYPGGASATFNVYHAPIAAISNVLVTREVTKTITRGGVFGGSDALPDGSVTDIIEVKQGGTTYVAGTDYVRQGDQVSWAPGGAEPSPSSSYTVKYRYLESTTVPFTATTVTVAGGVAGTLVILTYTFKLPRVDLLCLDTDGAPVYVKGIPARTNPMAPLPARDLLKLAEIRNTWNGKPEIVNSGTYAVTYEELWRYLRAVEEDRRLIALERLKSAIDQREPTAKLGLFVDPFTDDYYRDQGLPQTAALVDGEMVLAIDATVMLSTLTAPVLLDYVPQVVIAQERSTSCEKINPYQNFEPLPGALTLTPGADYWTDHQTEWTSPETRQFNRGTSTTGGTTTTTATELVSSRTEQVEFLRQISVAFSITGMAANETLTTLTFDGINVKPAGTVKANASGVCSGTFVIPANVTAGVKQVEAEGAGGTKALALFTGQGTVDVDVMRQVTTVNRWGRRTSASNLFASGKSDPQGETFMLDEPRQLIGVDFKLCAIGTTTNAILVHQTGTEGGVPNQDIAAEAFVPMTGAVPGWKESRYNAPAYTPAGELQAFVIKTDDAAHSISVANLNEFDEETQSRVGAQPYTVGTRVSGSQSFTWTPHQDSDITFRLVAAKFGPLTKTVPLGSFSLVGVSDLIVQAVTDIPSADCGVLFEIVRGDGSVMRVAAGQHVELTEYITETVQLRALLWGTEKLSPTLFAPVQLIAGKLRTSGTYVTRAFKFGNPVRLTSYFKGRLPSGSSVTVQYDKADGTWITLPQVGVETLQDPRWLEYKREASGIIATEGRIRFTLNGTPAARPAIADLSAATM